MNQKSSVQYFIVNSLLKKNQVSCHFPARKQSWPILQLTLVLPCAHICNTNSKGNLWRYRRQIESQNCNTCPSIGPFSVVSCERCGKELGSFPATDQCGQLLQGRKLLEHKTSPASPCGLALGMVQHCQAAGSYLYFLLLTHTGGSWTSGKAFPRLLFDKNPYPSHHTGEVSPTRFCWRVRETLLLHSDELLLNSAEHSPPDC